MMINETKLITSLLIDYKSVAPQKTGVKPLVPLFQKEVRGSRKRVVYER